MSSSNNFNSSANRSGQWNQQSGLNTYSSVNQPSTRTVEQVMLPTQVIEKPVAIHENIRKELVEEIQPVVNVEKLHTEVHQVTQPLFDKEVRPVLIENRNLAPEILPEVRVQGRGSRAQEDISSTRYLDTQTVVVEKPALYTEVERKQIIEEVQPVIYKETIVPTVIQETKPVYQKVVEGPVYSQETLAAKEIANPSLQAERYVSQDTYVAPTKQNVMLPTQIVEKPAAVHEDIRRETIEEITPVWNVEKLKTEVHQITAPLYDKEVRPVSIQQKTLNTEILPEVIVAGRGVRAIEDHSSTRYLDTQTTLVEKNPIINEVDRTQIIEEIQPVIYKETIVPTVIRETKPVFQKVVEGPVYVQETLAPRSLSETNYHYSSGSSSLSRESFSQQSQLSQQQQPLMQQQPFFPQQSQLPQQSFQQQSSFQQSQLSQQSFQQQSQFPQQSFQQQPSFQQSQLPQQSFQQQPSINKIVIVEEGAAQPISVGQQPIREVIVQLPQQPLMQQQPFFPQQHHKEIVEEIVTTTTTTTAAAPMLDNANGAHKRGGLFHRHNKDNTASGNTGSNFNNQGLGNSGSNNRGLNNSGFNSGSNFNNQGPAVEHFHNERTGPNGQKIIEDTNVTRSHTEQVLPSRLI